MFGKSFLRISPRQNHPIKFQSNNKNLGTIYFKKWKIRPHLSSQLHLWHDFVRIQLPKRKSDKNVSTKKPVLDDLSPYFLLQNVQELLSSFRVLVNITVFLKKNSVFIHGTTERKLPNRIHDKTNRIKEGSI